jgi:hypothetical protein
VTLTWTNTPLGFVLKQTESLTAPVQWTPVTNQPVLNNGMFVVTLPAGIWSRFYRLSYE